MVNYGWYDWKPLNLSLLTDEETVEMDFILSNLDKLTAYQGQVDYVEAISLVRNECIAVVQRHYPAGCGCLTLRSAPWAQKLWLIDDPACGDNVLNGVKLTKWARI